MLILLNLLVVVPHLFSLRSAHSLDSAFNDEVLGLMVFKAGLTDPQFRLTSWSEEDYTPCNWVGVKCYANSTQVSELILDGFSLSGHFGRSLLSLQHLTVLSLSRNNFSGPISPIISEIPSLKIINLSENNFSGSVSEELFQECRSLEAISLAKNSLTGPIPESLCGCSNLKDLDFSSNHFSGKLPSGLWFLSSLASLDLSDNWLSGEIPGGIDRLHNLRAINLRKNNFVGSLPVNIGRCSLLKTVDFGSNSLGGGLPPSLSKLGMCTYLDVSGNSLTGEFENWIGEMRRLEFLDLSFNSFFGQIPSGLGNLQSLKGLNLSNNRFSGSVPQAFENCINLKVLDVSQNLLSGNLPSWIFKLALERVSVSGNNLSGSITFPSASAITQSFRTFQFLDLSSNSFSGGMPSDLWNFSSLQALNMSCNALRGFIPAGVDRLNATRILDLSHNHLSGGIPPEIGGAVSLQELRLGSNFLTGAIPTHIQNCSLLVSLDLSRNNITGSVPIAFTSLLNLRVVDLSFNNLSGSLPKELTNLSHIVTFNVSYNHLEGELPSGGFFNTIPPSSLVGNPSLCGSIVGHSCPSVHPKPLVLNPNSSYSNHGPPLPPNLHHKRIALSISSFIAIGAAVAIAFGVVTVSILNMCTHMSKARSPTAFTFSGGDIFSPSNDMDENYGKLVIFSNIYDFSIRPQALLDKDCELGHGGFGTVYRMQLQDGCPSAVKKLNTTSLVKNQQDFEEVVKKLGKIVHPNVVQLKGYYWTPSLQLLISEYISPGSLHKHLHDGDPGSCLTWQRRLNVILGTAKGLAHLHQMNVIHYNIKSTNVLIDDNGEAKVGDYGLVGLLPALERCILSSKVQSALGYMAPEFACKTVKITEKSDVYGFGIFALEVLSGKRPVEYMEDDVIVLCDVVRGALEVGKVEECVDEKLKGNFPKEEAIRIVKLGLACTSQVPSTRPDMKEVVRILELIRCTSEHE